MAKKISVRVPENYSAETKDFMRKVLRALNENGELTPMMEGVVGMLRDTYETFQKASRAIRQDDDVLTTTVKDEVIAHPAVKIQMQANQQVLALMKELGLTTRSRKVIDKVGGGEPDQLSLFDSML